MAADTELITLRDMWRQFTGRGPTECPKCPCCTKALCEKAAEDSQHCVDLVQTNQQDIVRDCPCASPSSSVPEGNPDR